MQSAFAGIELGKRGLVSHSQGLVTVGHNITNASTEGYSRQRVELRAVDPLYDPALNREETPGQIGQGVSVASVTRIRDEILERRIVAGANAEGYWATQEKFLLMLERVYNEPEDISVRGLMDRFWESWQELSLHPEETAARQAVLQRGQTLMDGIHQRYRSLSDLRSMLEDEIQTAVGRVNTIIADIGALNEQIVKVKAMGDNPNDLLDRRDLLVSELSGLVDITTDGRDPNEFTIHTSGLRIVQGAKVHRFSLALDPDNDGFSRVVWGETGQTARFAGGKLAALLDLRDGTVREEVQNLDMMSVNFIDLVNEIHREGYGLSGRTGLEFFTEYPFITNASGNYDRNGDGAFDSSYIFRLTGANALEARAQLGLEGTLTLSGPSGNVTVRYFPTDTVEALVSRINNSGAEVVARLDREGRLTLKGAPAADPSQPDFVIRHVEDSGRFLTGYAGILGESGPDGAFRWDRADAVLALRGDGAYAVAPLAHPSGWIEINPELRNDPGSVAAAFAVDGRPGVPGDGSAALAIASIRNSSVMIGRTTTFDDYFADTVARIGLLGENAERALETHTVIMKELRDMQQSISGVNIDEELAQMIKFQHGYAAAARFITEFDKMLDTIINRLGA